MNKKVIISIIAIIAVIALVYFLMKRNKAQESEQAARAAEQAAMQKPVVKDEKAVKGGYFGAGDPTITPTKTNDLFTFSAGEKERWKDFNFFQKLSVFSIPGFFNFQKNN